MPVGDWGSNEHVDIITKMTSAEIRRLHSPDIPDLATYQPVDEEFGFLLQVIAGPAGQDGEESFDLTVCTPGWLSDKIRPSGMLVGRHLLIVCRYDYLALRHFLVDYCQHCRGDSWGEVAEQLGRLGKWEFEDYRP